MIDENTLESFANLFKDNGQLEKDYLLILMLKVISLNKISQSLELKGGRKFADLDSLLQPVMHDFGLSYKISKSKGNVVIRDEKGITGIRSEFFVEGPLFGKTGRRHKIKLDISTRNDLLMEPEQATLVSKYSDIGAIILYKMPLQEMLAEKLCAIAERAKARDLYDVYFLLKYKGLKYEESIVAKKFEKRGEAFTTEHLLSAIEKVSVNLWKEELRYIVPRLPDLGEVKEFIEKAISGSSKF